MSTEITDLLAADAAKVEEARERAEKAHAKVSTLCEGREKWTMCIPAQPDSDPDLVIGAALLAVRTVCDIATRRGRALEVAIAALSEFTREHDRKPHQYGQADTCPCDCCWTERKLAEVRAILEGKP